MTEFNLIGKVWDYQICFGLIFLLLLANVITGLVKLDEATMACQRCLEQCSYNFHLYVVQVTLRFVKFGNFFCQFFDQHALFYTISENDF